MATQLPKSNVFAMLYTFFLKKICSEYGFNQVSLSVKSQKDVFISRPWNQVGKYTALFKIESLQCGRGIRCRSSGRRRRRRLDVVISLIISCSTVRLLYITIMTFSTSVLILTMDKIMLDSNGLYLPSKHQMKRGSTT